MRLSKREFLEKEIKGQEKWIEQCGGWLEGYIEHYGSKHDTEHFGGGGEAIYAADFGHLKMLKERLALL